MPKPAARAALTALVAFALLAPPVAARAAVGPTAKASAEAQAQAQAAPAAKGKRVTVVAGFRLPR